MEELRSSTQAAFQGVLVVWKDAFNRPGWFGADDELDHEPITVETIGWLVDYNFESYTVATSVIETKAGDLLTVPRASVVSIKPLHFDVLDLDVHQP